jgi:hypothetical protein
MVKNKNANRNAFIQKVLFEEEDEAPKKELERRHK